MKIRPMFPFFGSKWNIARHYPAPTHPLVIEPFAGSAGYSSFYGVRNVLLNDADPILAGLWSYLIAAKTDDILALPDMPEVGDNVDNYDIPEAAKWLIGFWLNRGSASPKKTRTAYSARTDRAQLNWSPKAKERIASQLPLIRGWRVGFGDFADIPNQPAMWFIDPPYLDKGKFYRTKFHDFPRLAEWSLQRLGQTIVCEGVGADWLPFQHLGQFKTSTGKAAEVIFTNPPVRGSSQHLIESTKAVSSTPCRPDQPVQLELLG